MDDDVKIRARAAPEQIDDKDAVAAFDLAVQYRAAAQSAFAKSNRYTPGTDSARNHYRRYELYSEAADQWDAVVRAWIAKQVP